MAVCPPLDLELCSQALSAPGNWHIDRYYTRRLVQTAMQRQRLFNEGPPPRFPRRLNLRVFDEVYTAPRAGFRSRDDYYETSSARRVTAQITLPTLLLAAADDPIIPPRSYTTARFSPSTKVQLLPAGGHMGFIAKTRTRFGDLRWMDEAVVDWVEAPAT